MPSHKTFRIKKLVKKMRQNRPIPYWIRMRTDNTIRFDVVDEEGQGFHELQSNGGRGADVELIRHGDGLDDFEDADEEEGEGGKIAKTGVAAGLREQLFPPTSECNSIYYSPHKLCSHPLLVVGEKIPDQLSTVLSELLPTGSEIILELHKLHHSQKLVALQEILEECGIGVDSSGSESSVSIGQHRVLIFAQHKAFLDIIERDLFQTYMKNVTYLRLDGSVEVEKRFEIVKTFNSDPTIDVLLLTTHVGGLGLNLTSADTLVFVEHDWNPMRHHQANPNYKGVCHIALAQEGHTRPGEVCLICNLKAGFVLGTGKLLLKVPPTLRFVLDGEMPHYLLAKDLILQIIGEIGVAGATYKAMEFVGTTVESLNDNTADAIGSKSYNALMGELVALESHMDVSEGGGK
ncbi:hypothetical protein K1719_016442 [Acacia pycnantha]|nr:hypothetical protein K1719_016442 [Acacia pycnantha]